MGTRKCELFCHLVSRARVCASGSPEVVRQPAPMSMGECATTDEIWQLGIFHCKITKVVNITSNITHTLTFIYTPGACEKEGLKKNC